MTIGKDDMRAQTRDKGFQRFSMQTPLKWRFNLNDLNLHEVVLQVYVPEYPAPGCVLGKSAAYEYVRKGVWVCRKGLKYRGSDQRRCQLPT